jgi:hypothetical protein
VCFDLVKDRAICGAFAGGDLEYRKFQMFKLGEMECMGVCVNTPMIAIAGALNVPGAGVCRGSLQPRFACFRLLMLCLYATRVNTPMIAIAGAIRMRRLCGLVCVVWASVQCMRLHMIAFHVL